MQENKSRRARGLARRLEAARESRSQEERKQGQIGLLRVHRQNRVRAHTRMIDRQASLVIIPFEHCSTRPSHPIEDQTLALADDFKGGGKVNGHSSPRVFRIYSHSTATPFRSHTSTKALKPEHSLVQPDANTTFFNLLNICATTTSDTRFSKTSLVLKSSLPIRNVVMGMVVVAKASRTEAARSPGLSHKSSHSNT